MRVSSSLKVILSTWIAALIGATAGRVLAEATTDSRPADAAVHARVDRSIRGAAGVPDAAHQPAH
jgi:hypothetical protein